MAISEDSGSIRGGGRPIRRSTYTPPSNEPEKELVTDGETLAERRLAGTNFKPDSVASPEELSKTEVSGQTLEWSEPVLPKAHTVAEAEGSEPLSSTSDSAESDDFDSSYDTIKLPPRAQLNQQLSEYGRQSNAQTTNLEASAKLSNSDNAANSSESDLDSNFGFAFIPAAQTIPELSPPPRQSLTQPELEQELADRMQGQDADTLPLIEFLEQQISLREKEAEEFRSWEEKLIGLGTVEAIKIVEDSREIYSDLIVELPELPNYQQAESINRQEIPEKTDPALIRSYLEREARLAGGDSQFAETKSWQNSSREQNFNEFNEPSAESAEGFGYRPDLQPKADLEPEIELPDFSRADNGFEGDGFEDNSVASGSVVPLEPLEPLEPETEAEPENPVYFSAKTSTDSIEEPYFIAESNAEPAAAIPDLGSLNFSFLSEESGSDSIALSNSDQALVSDPEYQEVDPTELSSSQSGSEEIASNREPIEPESVAELPAELEEKSTSPLEAENQIVTPNNRVQFKPSQTNNSGNLDSFFDDLLSGADENSSKPIKLITPSPLTLPSEDQITATALSHSGAIELPTIPAVSASPVESRLAKPEPEQPKTSLPKKIDLDSLTDDPFDFDSLDSLDETEKESEIEKEFAQLAAKSNNKLSDTGKASVFPATAALLMSPRETVERIGVKPTELQHRNSSAAKLFWLWFSVNSSLITLVMIAAIFELGLSLRQTLVAIMIGLALSSIPLGLGTLAGKRSGQPAMVVSRASFGLVGNILPAILIVIIRLFWSAAILWVAASASRTVISVSGYGNLIGLNSEQILQVILGIFALVLITLVFFGEKIITKTAQIFGVISFVLAIGFVALTWQYVNFDTALQNPDGSWILVVNGAVIIFSLVGLTWAASGADFARYQKSGESTSKAMVSSVLGTLVPAAIVLGYGALLVASNPEIQSGLISDPVTTMAAMLPDWYPIPLVLALSLSLLAGALISSYSAGLAVLSSGIRGAQPWVMVTVGILVGAVAFGLSLVANPMTAVLDTAAMLSVPLSAWLGIFAMEIMIRSKPYHSESLLSLNNSVYPKFRLFNLIGFALAIAIGFGLNNSELFTGSWQGYLLPLLGIGIENPLYDSNFGVLVAFLVGSVVVLASAIPAIKKQERLAAQQS